MANKLKDHYYQLSENLFDKREIRKLIVKYGDTGLKWWIKIELDLLKNNGVGELDWNFYSSNIEDKDVIEYIINMNIDNNDGTFSSEEVNRQLKERHETSERQRIRIQNYWDKQKEKEKKEKVKGKVKEKVDLMVDGLTCKWCGGSVKKGICNVCGEKQ
ncbi:MAG: hypothetical protein PHX04_06265 [Bacilli bacterium]|nr:hypothetical protein [Bacilli bacterium]